MTALEIELADFGEAGRVVVRVPPSSYALERAGFRLAASECCEVCLEAEQHSLARVGDVATRTDLCIVCAGGLL